MIEIERAAALSQFVTSYSPTIEDAYRMGKDCARNGPNEQNCHFRIFRSPEHTKAWERGKAEGK